MKTFGFFLVMFLSILSVNVNGQIQVLSNGNVGIKTTTPNEALEINGNIRGNFSGGALQINTAVNGYLQLGPQNNTACHIYTNSPNFVFNKTLVSLNGDFASYYQNDLILKTGVSFYNYSGDVRMTIKNSTGYVGINNTNPSCALDVTGAIKTNGVLVTSDERLKKNIATMTGSMAKLSKLRGVTYKFKTDSMIATPAAFTQNSVSTTDSTQKQSPKFVGDTLFYNRTHIGFLAQEIQAVYPNLVYTDKKGLLSVDYISLIPVIIEALKEQQGKSVAKDSLNSSLTKQVAMLQNVVTSQEQNFISLQNQINDIKKNCCGGSTPKTKSAKVDETDNSLILSTKDIILYQNVPNPFTQTTEIKYALPENVGSASLYILNMQGTLIKNIPITNRGNGSIILNGSELSAGMYLYSLIADGKEIDTKRMILTN